MEDLDDVWIAEEHVSKEVSAHVLPHLGFGILENPQNVEDESPDSTQLGVKIGNLHKTDEPLIRSI